MHARGKISQRSIHIITGDTENIQIVCGDCEPIIWITPVKGTRINPPTNTVAVVVDVGSNRGAIRIFEKEGGGYVNIIGMEEAGNQVIVPWDTNWWLRASGSLQVGYIVEKTK
jgi:hypothetical protein